MVKQEKSAGAVVYLLEGNEPVFLLLQNTLKKTYWEFPKGEIENESLEETAKREVREETGLVNLELIKGFKHALRWFFRFSGELISKEAVYFLIRIPSEDKNKVKISKEHQKFEWMNYEKAIKEINIKSNREMLEKAHAFIKEHEKQRRLV